jgi:hypothetical protein
MDKKFWGTIETPADSGGGLLESGKMNNKLAQAIYYQ